MVHAKTQTGEDETLPTKGSHFAVVVSGVNFLYQAQEYHKMRRATTRKREDSSWNACSVEKPEVAETIGQSPDKTFSTCYVADLITGTLVVGNNPNNFQMQAFWSNQCALS
jgi:hypothetical protein